MGLLNKKNIAKAKAMAEKNKEKIASGVTKATDTIDKKTGGKYSDKLHKVDDAAKKYAGTTEGADETATNETAAHGGATNDGAVVDGATDVPADPPSA